MGRVTSSKECCRSIEFRTILLVVVVCNLATRYESEYRDIEFKNSYTSRIIAHVPIAWFACFGVAAKILVGSN